MNASGKIYDEIWRKQTSDEPFVLATIVKTLGSSPQEVGAKMLIFPDGTIFGTIGGGTFEKMVIEDSLEMFRTGKRFQLKNYRFSRNGPHSTGMSCGGEALVFFERNGQADKLFIFGGGHIGSSLSRIVEGLNFKVTIIDDRKDILKTYHPPVEVLLTDPDYHENFPKMDDHSYAVIVTRSHSCDRNVLEKAIEKDCAYIGMIGSKNKVQKLFSELIEKGIGQERLKNVHAPIGLDIGARSPEEIAISIAAEIIRERRKRSEGR